MTKFKKSGMRKKTTYLFLTNTSNTIEGKGFNRFQAQKEAERVLEDVKPEAKIVAYDTFDREGVSYNNWKRLGTRKND